MPGGSGKKLEVDEVGATTSTSTSTGSTSLASVGVGTTPTREDFRVHADSVSSGNVILVMSKLFSLPLM